MHKITREMLRDFANEALPDAEMTHVEKAIRESATIQALFHSVRQEIDRGEHSVGAIWRRDRLSCLSREQLGSYLLQAIDPDLSDYISFHLKTIGCPVCQANVEDLERLQGEKEEPVKKRRQRIVKSSAGVLRGPAGK